MACSGCSTGRGKGTPAGCRSNGQCGINGCNKLDIFDWLANMKLPDGQRQFDIVEVRFKNSRKDFYKNTSGADLYQGDVVAVEGSPGHDIGTVSLSGELVKLQMKKLQVSYDSPEIKALYRKAKPADIDKWQATINREVETMYKARVIASGLGLEMKLSDVEFQGDGSKATFFYTAPDRVDFRELIKKLAEEFRVRIEMRQIGQRQESARLGGIGSCGRELCCSTWLRDFRTVNTSAARYQQLALNPQKLAGQCGKLKCCLNYELDSYMDALKGFPETDKPIETKVGIAFYQKMDIFRRIMWYSYKENPGVFIAVPVDRVKDLYQMAKDGIIADDLLVASALPKHKEPDYENVVGQDSLTRFDKSKKKGSNNNRRKVKGGNRDGQNQGPRNDGQNRPEKQQNTPKNENKGGDNQQQNNRPPRNENRNNDGQNNNRPPRNNENRKDGDNNNRPPRHKNRGPRNNNNRPPKTPPPPPQQ